MHALPHKTWLQGSWHVVSSQTIHTYKPYWLGWVFIFEVLFGCHDVLNFGDKSHKMEYTCRLIQTGLCSHKRELKAQKFRCKEDCVIHDWRENKNANQLCSLVYIIFEKQIISFSYGSFCSSQVNGEYVEEEDNEEDTTEDEISSESDSDSEGKGRTAKY